MPAKATHNCTTLSRTSVEANGLLRACLISTHNQITPADGQEFKSRCANPDDPAEDAEALREHMLSVELLKLAVLAKLRRPYQRGRSWLLPFETNDRVVVFSVSMLNRTISESANQPRFRDAVRSLRGVCGVEMVATEDGTFRGSLQRNRQTLVSSTDNLERV